MTVCGWIIYWSGTNRLDFETDTDLDRLVCIIYLFIFLTWRDLEFLNIKSLVTEKVANECL